MDDLLPRSITTTSAGDIAISMPLPEPSETAAQPPSWFGTLWSMLRVHVVMLLAVYPSFIGLLQLKYQSKEESAFETHSFFMITSVIAIVIFVLSYWILDYKTKNLSMNQLSPPSILHMILTSAAFFSIILALLSLVFVLLLPPNFIWIGYSATCLLLIAIIAYCSIHKVTALGKKMRIVISKIFNHIRDMI